ncbi:hypothetical protein QR680_013565 [Steinernema hermaphroditum]|uniref:Peptidase S1 domain-containing protein n=1 Tax=Steinernema hermaphroditum TaxID=289476 RepID=A0AA39I8K5_9BILA|nr:hypothetical protein QR680_013565 [Steinernema hermaphroditum]
MRILSILFLFFALASAKDGVVHDRIISEMAVFPADPDVFYERVQKVLNSSNLVFGGQRAQAGQFPQQAFLSYASKKGGYYICGATLLSTTHAVTAGHCTVDMTSPAEIMVGGTNVRDRRSGNAQWRNIHRVTTYRQYNPDDRRIRKDIGIVEFNPPVSLNRDVKLTKVVADDSQLLRSQTAFISGYGAYTYRGDQSVSSENLLWAEVGLLSFDQCQQRWRILDPDRNQICAGSQGRGTGPGDSGGPIQVKYNGELYQVGLTSFGSANPYDAMYNQQRFPPVFTRLSSYCDFIQTTTGGRARCGSLNGGGDGGNGGDGGDGGDGNGGDGGSGGDGCQPTPAPTRPPPPPSNCDSAESQRGYEFIY